MRLNWPKLASLTQKTSTFGSFQFFTCFQRITLVWDIFSYLKGIKSKAGLG